MIYDNPNLEFQWEMARSRWTKPKLLQAIYDEIGNKQVALTVDVRSMTKDEIIDTFFSVSSFDKYGDKPSLRYTCDRNIAMQYTRPLTEEELHAQLANEEEYWEQKAEYEHAYHVFEEELEKWEEGERAHRAKRHNQEEAYNAAIQRALSRLDCVKEAETKLWATLGYDVTFGEGETYNPLACHVDLPGEISPDMMEDILRITGYDVKVDVERMTNSRALVTIFEKDQMYPEHGYMEQKRFQALVGDNGYGKADAYDDLSGYFGNLIKRDIGDRHNELIADVYREIHEAPWEEPTHYGAPLPVRPKESDYIKVSLNMPLLIDAPEKKRGIADEIAAAQAAVAASGSREPAKRTISL